MTATDPLRHSRCAICPADAADEDEELYPANLASEDFNDRVFSARRLPDGVHCRIVRCRRCGLVRSDPSADPMVLSRLYRDSGFDYDGEVPNLVRTYGRYLARIAGRRRSPSALLEVGSGNGFMLAEGLRLGYETVTGVEPSEQAVASAIPEVRSYLVNDVLHPGVLEEGRFDTVCLFQVLDHLPDPGQALDEIARALKPGGVLLLLNHNVRAVSARILGRRSPIIDVEHTYLYDPVTVTRLCRNHGFVVEQVGMAWNWCSLGYLVRLLPMPSRARRTVTAVLEAVRLAGVSLPLPLGNLYVLARTGSLGQRL